MKGLPADENVIHFSDGSVVALQVTREGTETHFVLLLLVCGDSVFRILVEYVEEGKGYFIILFLTFYEL